ncbi:RraA family protein [Streptomyces sp. NPDC005968]|uniref:RraA family protein n=2 Tax=unclassified Streptomyces TaxID=2593676 RepID=UPI0033DA9EF5
MLAVDAPFHEVRRGAKTLLFQKSAFGDRGGLGMETGDRLRDLAQRVGTADVVDALGRVHRHRSHLVDLASPAPDRLLFGPAVTISFFPACEAALPSETFNFPALFSEAVREGGEGRVLVMASNGYPDTSMAGGTKLSLLRHAGVSGLLADGRIRDFDELADTELAVYCRGEAVAWGGATVTPFEANRPVVLGGVGVMPGDYVFAKGSNAVVIPRDQVLDVLEDAERTMGEEADLATRWTAGTPESGRADVR